MMWAFVDFVPYGEKVITIDRTVHVVVFKNTNFTVQSCILSVFIINIVIPNDWFITIICPDI